MAPGDGGESEPSSGSWCSTSGTCSRKHHLSLCTIVTTECHGNKEGIKCFLLLFFYAGPLLSLSWLVCCTRPSEQSFQSDVLLLLWLLLLFYQQSIDIIVNYFCVEKTDNNVSMQLVHCRSAPELSRLAKLQRIFVVQVNIWLVVIWLYVTKFGFVYTLT